MIVLLLESMHEKVFVFYSRTKHCKIPSEKGNGELTVNVQNSGGSYDPLWTLARQTKKPKLFA